MATQVICSGDSSMSRNPKRKLGSVAPCSEGACLLPADLHEFLAAARRAAAELRLAEAENAYRLALLVRAATGRHGGRGGSALAARAQLLGVSRSTLQPFSIIASCWSPDELRTIFERSDSRSLSVSHLLLIGQLPGPTRHQWIERVLAEGLGVHELRSRLKAAATGPVGRSGNRTPLALVTIDKEHSRS
jgi:hypothetical protein